VCERECCLLVLNSVTSTPQWIRQPEAAWGRSHICIETNDVHTLVVEDAGLDLNDKTKIIVKGISAAEAHAAAHRLLAADPSLAHIGPLLSSKAFVVDCGTEKNLFRNGSLILVMMIVLLLFFGWVVAAVGSVGVWGVWVGPGLVWMGCGVFAAALLWGGRLRRCLELLGHALVTVPYWGLVQGARRERAVPEGQAGCVQRPCAKTG
jgi:hypothetical protein